MVRFVREHAYCGKEHDLVVGMRLSGWTREQDRENVIVARVTIQPDRARRHGTREPKFRK